MPDLPRLSAPAARRIALAAQGFADPRPTGRVDARHIRRVLARIAILQIDSVNVFSRTHYLPLFSRLGPYRRDLLDTLTAHTAGPVRRELFEYWAHEASLIPVEYQPLLRWRMERAHLEAWGGIKRLVKERPGLVEQIFELVRDHGPLRAGETGIQRPARRPGEMWDWHDGKANPPQDASSARSGFWQWSDTKTALEYLFYKGEITTARRVNFERHYDLTERVLPPEILAAPTPSDAEAMQGLTRIAARAMGVATEPDLRDYFRVPPQESKHAVAELVEAGELIPCTVVGWRDPAYLWHAARRPRSVSARALLSPFDNLIWFRPRTERIFGMRYRIEIYTPQPKRVFGYYVLPFLLGDSLVARVDLKSDRQRGVLLVQSAWLEEGEDSIHVARELAEELTTTATWLGLGSVEVAPVGNLAGQLAAVLYGS